MYYEITRKGKESIIHILFFDFISVVWDVDTKIFLYKIWIVILKKRD